MMILVLVSLATKSWSVLSPFSKTLLNTRSPTGSLTDKRMLLTASTAKLSPTVLTPSFVRILSVLRRSVLTVVFVTTGVSVSVVNTPRLLVAVVAPLVSPRRNKVRKDQ